MIQPNTSFFTAIPPPNALTWAPEAVRNPVSSQFSPCTLIHAAMTTIEVEHKRPHQSLQSKVGMLPKSK